MVRHLKGKVSEALQRVSVSPGDMILDVGSNDGTTLDVTLTGPWTL